MTTDQRQPCTTLCGCEDGCSQIVNLWFWSTVLTSSVISTKVTGDDTQCDVFILIVTCQPKIDIYIYGFYAQKNIHNHNVFWL